MVTVNSSHTFAQQVAAFAQCDVLASVHGSQNANVMWMRPGAAFMELNPHKFFYSSYQEVNGEPVVGSAALLQGLLRERLGFEGLLVTDWHEVRPLACPSVAECAAAPLHAFRL